jgi:membrane protease YdiL (CAAX protease family)
MNKEIYQSKGQRIVLILVAWSSIVMISELPDIICKYASGSVPGWMFWFKTCFMASFLIACLLYQNLRLLLPYAFVMLIFYLALSASDWLRTSAWWMGLIGEEATPSFLLMYLRPFIRDTGVTIIVIFALWIVKKKRSEFFLVKGQLDAPIEPVIWMGIKKPEPWRKFAWIFGIVAALAVAVPTILALHPSAEVLKKCIPLIPAVILFAGVNAFNEEVYFRATILSTLTQVIGKTNAILINVVFFGLAHYLYGSPPGVTGFLMTGFLAFLLGKSMLETKGFLWPWLIHFLPDVMIFFSYAIVWIRQT